MLLKKGFKYRLDPTDSQRQLFAQFAGASRFLYNRGLEERKTAYEKEGRSITYFGQNDELVSLKRQEGTAWLQDVHSQVLQQALKNLDNAFQQFFENVKAGRKPGFPRFKCKGMRDSFRYPQGVKIDGQNAYLPKRLSLKLSFCRFWGSFEPILHSFLGGNIRKLILPPKKECKIGQNNPQNRRSLNSTTVSKIGWVRFRKSREIEGVIKQTTIRREGDHWTVSFSCEIEKSKPLPAPISEERAIGIDMGLTRFATIASGRDNHPEYIANLIEKGTRNLSRSIADAGWGFFLRCLSYKAKERGKHFIETGKYFASTQTCSSCYRIQRPPGCRS